VKIGIAAVLAQKCEDMKSSLEGAGATYPFPMLCDEDRAVIKAYGVWHPLGIDAWNSAHPACFLIAPDRRVVYSFVGSSQFARVSLEKILNASGELAHVR
jgi:peroxiredoxin